MEDPKGIFRRDVSDENFSLKKGGNEGIEPEQVPGKGNWNRRHNGETAQGKTERILFQEIQQDLS